MTIIRQTGSYLVGLDVGSTLIKEVLFDFRGRVIPSAVEAVRVNRPRSGWVEREADATWRAAATVLRRTVRGLAERIVAVGITGCGNGAVFLDRKLSLLLAGILSSHSRAVVLRPRPRRNRGHEPYPGQLPVLLQWFCARERVKARRLAHVLFWKDFICARLSGVTSTDYTDAGAAGLLKYPTRRVLFSIPELPRLQDSLNPAGSVTLGVTAETGLKAGTTVYTACIDCGAAALGGGIHAPGAFSIVAGTWSSNQTYATRPPKSGRYFLVNESVEAGRWPLLEGSPNSMANFDWALGCFGSGLSAAPATTEARRTPPSDLLFILQVPKGQGAFVGLGPRHGRGAIFRAVLEGVVFAHRVHLEKLRAVPRLLDGVTLAGGAARSPFWCRLFADGLGCPIHVPRSKQIGAPWAAICAGTGAGLWSAVQHAQRALAPGKRTFKPDQKLNSALCHEYARYQCYHQGIAS